MEQIYTTSYRKEQRQKEERKGAIYISTLISIGLLSLACYKGCHGDVKAEQRTNQINNIEWRLR